MTVEQSALPRRVAQSRNSDQSNTGTTVHESPANVKVIKERTGVSDITIINEAISACCNEDGSFKLEDVITTLQSDDTVRKIRTSKFVKDVVDAVPRYSETESRSVIKTTASNTATTATVSVASQSQSTTATGSGSGVIDLTKDTTGDNEDLQKAIAASLHETPGILGGQVTREEQDISRILEASLAESKAGTKRKRGDIWFVDPLNPHERKRVEQWPVGLKNVGNTCWFSAVIQSLFHIRQFRQLVLNFDFSVANSDNGDGPSTDSRNVSFMEELQCLFALLVGTSKKYVDPSKPVEILKEAFTSPTGANNSQQDVSEFQHKLLEWLEDAFKVYENKPEASASQTEKADCDTSNVKSPVVDLFYGQFKAEGIHEGKGFSNLETFGQFPLQVSGFRDIHESLEAATSPAEIEAVSSDVTQKSGQELWFTRLPPVLTFELSRFQFNQQIGRPEKIHNKIQFPEVIYMDRYMERNQSITRQRREDGKKLKEQLRLLKAKLDKFLRYGSGNKRVPLQDVLQYALEFAQSQKHDRTSLSASNQDIEMESPRTNSNNSNEKSARLTEGLPDLTDIAMTTYNQSPGPSAHTVDGVTAPYPRHVADSELEVLESCLRRWRTEVESDVRELQENISSLEEKVSGMYSDESMKKFPYHLHAVLVHEGQAASGHYWAYIYDILREKWLKFNDITVTESSWEELEKEGVGGYHNASAYCLMYVDRSKLQFNTGDSAKSLDSMDCLPPALHKMVTEDNKLFVKEIQSWNEEQARKMAEAEAKTASEKKIAKNQSTASTQTSQTVSRFTLPITITHANISITDTLKAVKQYVDQTDYSPKDSMIQAVNQELKRLSELTKRVSAVLPQDDLRLQHILIYMGHNSADIKLQQIVELEQFSFLKDLDKSERGKEMRKFASEYVQRQNEYGSDIYKHLEEWHSKYQLYRDIVYLFIKGLEAYSKERYAESLPYLDKAWHCNIDCTVNGKHEGFGVNINILAYFRRTCLQCLNTSAAELFESEEDASEALTLMNSLILPTLPLLSTSGINHDIIAAEEMREKWCAFLGEQLSESKIDKLQDFLSKLFEPPTESKRLNSQQHIRTNDMSDLYVCYKDIMDTLCKSGQMQKALACL